MLDVSSKDKVVVIFRRVVDGVLKSILAILGPAWLKAVDILPCLRFRKSEIVGRHADDCPVLFVMS